MISNLTQLTQLENEYPYLADLNYMQQIAASSTIGNHIVLAGPGTGKTHTLAYRTMHLIKQGVDPANICLITFTRKAASTLKARIKNLLPDVKLGFIGTFHSLATNILSEVNHLQGWRLINQSEDIALITMTTDGGELSAKRLSQIFSYYANTKKPMEQVLISLNLQKYIAFAHKIEQAYEHYQATKLRMNYLTYDDLLAIPASNHQLSQNVNFEFLMIDEFQDVSQLQIDFIKSLNCPNTMVIGDDFQNIYSFRGSDSQLILNIDKYLNDPKLITFTRNYRSTINICNYANKIVKQTKFGFEKHISSNFSDSDINPKLQIHSGLEDINELILNKVVNSKEQHAILYRRSNMRVQIETMLITNNIPYQIAGGQNLLDRKHIKNLLAIIKLINNPDDYLAHIHVLLLDSKLDLTSASKLLNSQDRFQPQTLPTTQLLASKLSTPQQIVDMAIDYYQVNIAQKSQAITNDFLIISSLARKYTHILAFINDFSLEPTVDYNSDDSSKPRVILSTIHASKGLEFDHVHLLHGFNNLHSMPLTHNEEEARLLYVAITRAKHNLSIYDNFSTKRSLNDLINDYIANPKRESYNLIYDDEQTSNVTKVTLHLEDDYQTHDDTQALSINAVIDYFRK